MQRSTTLAAGSWTAVAQLGPLASPGPARHTDPNPPLAGNRFYRVAIRGD